MIYLILFLALFLRLFRLDALSLFGDEIDVGYHAWSLITTGRDYYGQLLPSYIHSLAEWRAPLLMYVTAPFVGLLGPSLWSIRLPVVLLGISNVYLVYLLGNLLFVNTLRLKLRNKIFEVRTGELAAFILAITPWHFHYSRAAFEVTLLLTLLLLGVYLFLRKNSFYLLPFVLTFYTYSTANLFTPLLLIVLFLIYRPKISKKFVISSIFPFLLALPIFYQLAFGPAAGRFNLISIFNDPKITENIILNRIEPWVNQEDEAIFHNRPLSYLTIFTHQYLESFSPQFLFLDGDPFFRHSSGQFGELLLITLPFFILGLTFILNFSQNKHSQLLLAWLLLSPIPSSLTQHGGEHATRLFIMLPALVLITALGITTLSGLKYRYRNLLIPTLLLATLVNFSLFAHHYFNHYPFQSAALWGYGYKDAFERLDAHLSEANRVFINNTYHPSLILFAFYTKFLPKDFQQSFQTDIPQNSLIPSFDGFKFKDKYYFGQLHNDLIEPTYRIPEVLESGDYYLAVQLKEIPGDWNWAINPPKQVVFVDQVLDPYQKPLFTIFKLE